MADELPYTGVYRITWDGPSAPYSALSVVVSHDGQRLFAQIDPETILPAEDAPGWLTMATKALESELSFLNHGRNPPLPGWIPVGLGIDPSFTAAATDFVAESLRKGFFPYPVSVEVHNAALASSNVGLRQPIDLSGDRILTLAHYGDQKPPTLVHAGVNSWLPSEAPTAKVFVRCTHTPHWAKESSTNFNVVVTRPLAASMPAGSPASFDGDNMQGLVNWVLRSVAEVRRSWGGSGPQICAREAIQLILSGLSRVSFGAHVAVFETARDQSRGLEPTDEVFADVNFEGYFYNHVTRGSPTDENYHQWGESDSAHDGDHQGI